MMTLYTIGHSNGSVEEFVSLLSMSGVTCVVDVRSIPYSSYTPQFNKENLSVILSRKGILYLHFGIEFGARRIDSIVDGQVCFEQAVKTDSFLRGVARIKDGLQKGYSIAFMCSEANPLSCHRFSLVSRFFYDNEYSVFHILHSGEVVDHKSLEEQMIRDYLKNLIQGYKR